MSVGYRSNTGAVVLAVFMVYKESFEREDFLLAGETVSNKCIVDVTTAMLESLNHCGFFTLNWLQYQNQYLLSSLRPVPKGVFSVLKKTDIDYLSMPDSGVYITPEGVKFIADAHYSNYRSI